MKSKEGSLGFWFRTLEIQLCHLLGENLGLGQKNNILSLEPTQFGVSMCHKVRRIDEWTMGLESTVIWLKVQ
jgi:hypothetical protein